MKTYVADSPGELAKHIGDVLNEHAKGEHYRRLPYNRFDNYLNHLTWLVPGAERVAFSRSKFFFDWYDQDAGEIWFGIHLEKGVSKDAARSKSDNGLMTPDWAWHSVFPQLGNSSMMSAIEQVNTAMDGTGRLRLMISPYSDGISRDCIQGIDFKMDDSGLIFDDKSGLQHICTRGMRASVLRWLRGC